MADLILPNRLTQQPQWAAPIDNKNPLANGLKAVFCPSIKNADILGSTASYRYEQDHNNGPVKSIFTDVVATTSLSKYSFNPITSSEWTFIAIASRTSAGSYETLLDFESSVDPTNIRTSIAFGAFNSQCVGSDSRPYAPDINSATTWPSDRKSKFVAVTISASQNNVTGYFGKNIAFITTVASTAQVTLDQIQFFSKSGASQVDPGAGSISLVLIYNRALSNIEILAINANPWQVLTAPSRRLWLASGGAASAFSGTPSDVANATGALSTSIKLTGAAVDAALASGSLLSNILMSSNALNVATATAALTTSIKLNSAAADVSSASASLLSSILMAGNPQAIATASATLNAGQFLSGNLLAQALSAGALTTSINLTGTAINSATATGALNAQVGLSINALSQSTLAGLLSTGINLVTTAQNTANASGLLFTSIAFNSNAQVNASATANIATTILLAGAANNLASASASFNQIGVQFQGAAIAVASMLASITTQINFATNAVSRVIANGNVNTNISFAGNASEIALATGDLTTLGVIILGVRSSIRSKNLQTSKRPANIG